MALAEDRESLLSRWSRLKHRQTTGASTAASGDGPRRGGAMPVALDVTDAASVQAAVEATETELGPISILVNNSGVAVVKPALEQDEADWDKVLDTNPKGAWLVAQSGARCMARHGHGGSIGNIASTTGGRPAGPNPAPADSTLSTATAAPRSIASSPASGAMTPP